MICKREGCGRQTNNTSGVCTICNMFGDLNDELQNTEGASRKSYPNGTKSAMTIEREAKEKEARIMAEKKSSHKRCSIDGCDKQAWRKGMCYKHFHATGGQENPDTVARKTRKPKERKQPTPAPLQGGELMPHRLDAKVEIFGPSVDRTLHLLKLQKENLEREIAEIDTAIRTIEKYAV